MVLLAIWPRAYSAPSNFTSLDKTFSITSSASWKDITILQYKHESRGINNYQVIFIFLAQVIAF